MSKVQTKTNVGTNLTQGPLMRTLLIFSGPIVLTNIVQQLYSMVDLAIAGQFVGNGGTVGVNTGGEIADIMVVVAMGFATAGQIYIAQLFGAGEERKIKRTIGTLLSFSLLVGVALGILIAALATPVLNLLNCPEEAFIQATNYMRITAIGIPFVMGYNAVCGVLRGMGESQKPLIFILVAASINIVFDLVLVVVFQWGVAGTAIATILSQMGSFFAALIFMALRREQFDFELKPAYFRLDGHILIVLLRLGIPQVARGLLVRFSLLYLNAIANSYGVVVSATNSIGNKLQKFLEVFIQSIDTASASMIAQNLGAKKTERAGKTVYCTLCASLICAVVSSILCLLIPQFVFRIFTKDADVIALGTIYLHIMVVHFFASATVGAFQSMVTGAGFVSLGFAIGILDGVICKIGLSLLFVYVFNMGYLGLFWGVALSRILPAVLCAAYYFSGRWKTRKLVADM